MLSETAENLKYKYLLSLAYVAIDREFHRQIPHIEQTEQSYGIDDTQNNLGLLALKGQDVPKNERKVYAYSPRI